MAKKEPAKFLLRLDPAVMAAVKRWADAELRSVNGQIEYILREALAKRGVKVEPLTETDETPSDPAV
jgi:hypothetical protein